MARRGTVKDLSVRHEEYIAKLYEGKRSKSSGAADNDQGDVRTPALLIECKMSSTRIPKLIRDFEKVAEEAWSESRDPIVALRYYAPDSRLANSEGWVDLTVMLARDHAEKTNAGKL